RGHRRRPREPAGGNGDRDSMNDATPTTEAERLAADLLPSRMDELALAGRTENAMLNVLWAAAFALPRWYFAGEGEFPKVRPAAVVIDKRPFVMAFTAKGRAHEYALERGLVPIAGKPSVLSFPVESAIRHIVGLQSAGIFGVFFDNHRGGWCIPTERLPGMYEHFKPGAPGAEGVDPGR
ncbi:MAG: hypothetical protein P8J59_11495, partial [Phycisphaerales bacterium]|nr:hypothetical protein [Phycisphaerales bacterium]